MPKVQTNLVCKVTSHLKSKTHNITLSDAHASATRYEFGWLPLTDPIPVAIRSPLVLLTTQPKDDSPFGNADPSLTALSVSNPSVHIRCGSTRMLTCVKYCISHGCKKVCTNDENDSAALGVSTLILTIGCDSGRICQLPNSLSSTSTGLAVGGKLEMSRVRFRL